MAYIPWWQRMSPPTFTERFDLGGLAGRVGFFKGSSLPQSTKDLILKYRIENKFGSNKIAEILKKNHGITLNQATVGGVLTQAKKDGVPGVNIAKKDLASTIEQQKWTNPKARKIHNVVRKITALDRKQNPNIPKNAKYRIVFATPQGKTTKIPEEFIGTKYFENKAAANKAVNKRLKADFIISENPGAAKLKTQRKRSAWLKRTAPFYPTTGVKGKFQFHHIMPIGGSVSLTLDDIAIISKEMNTKLSDVNKRLNNIADEIDDLYVNQPDGFLKKVEKLNDTAEGIVKNKLKSLPKEYKKLIGFNRVDPIFDNNGVVIDYKVTKVGGINKTGRKLVDLNKQETIDLKKKILQKSKELDIEDRNFLKKVKKVGGKVLKTTGKLIRPVGYLIGANAVLQAKALAKEEGIDLKLVDYYAALEMGDSNAAFDMWKMRNDPEFKADEMAKLPSLDEGTYEVIEESVVAKKDGGLSGVDQYIINRGI